MHKAESVLGNVTHEMLWNFQIKTRKTRQDNNNNNNNNKKKKKKKKKKAER